MHHTKRPPSGAPASCRLTRSERARGLLFSRKVPSPSPQPSPWGRGRMFGRGGKGSLRRELSRPVAECSLSLGVRIPRRDSRFEPPNCPLSRLRHPLPPRGGEGKGEGAVHLQCRFTGRARVSGTVAFNRINTANPATCRRSGIAGCAQVNHLTLVTY